MITIVAEGKSKLFISPNDGHIQAALNAQPAWIPRGKLPNQAMSLRVQGYGITDWYELFTSRQLIALTTFSDLIADVRSQIAQDGADDIYTDAVCTYLSFAVNRTAESGCSFTLWDTAGNSIMPAFGRQAIPMVWDFVEANPFSTSTQNWMAQIEWVARSVARFLPRRTEAKRIRQMPVRQIMPRMVPVIVTDPPYYDNIGYADLSDFFIKLYLDTSIAS